MKLSLTLLLIFGFIAFIGAAPTEDVSVEADPKEEDVPEVPALDDKDEPGKDDENDEEAPVEATDEIEDSMMKEVPALDDEDNELKDDENDEEVPEGTVAEKDENEDEKSDEEENDVAEDPKRGHHHHKGGKKGRRSCRVRGFKRKVFCQRRKYGRKFKVVCYSCCHKCIIRHRCRHYRRSKSVCFNYLRRFCKGHRHRYRRCYKAQHSCAIFGRCWSNGCYRVRRPHGKG